MPLCATLGIGARRFGPDAVELELEWAHGLCTSGGVLRGGVLMALADDRGRLVGKVTQTQAVLRPR